MTQAAVETGDMLFLTEMVGEKSAVCVAVAPGKRLGRMPVKLGEDLPLGTMSCTRVLLLNVREDRLSDIVARTLASQNSASQRSQKTAMMRLRTTRKAGFDVGEGELEPSLWALSVPLRESPGMIRQSLTLVTTISRAARQRTRTALMTRGLGVAHVLADTEPLAMTAAAGMGVQLVPVRPHVHVARR